MYSVKYTTKRGRRITVLVGVASRDDAIKYARLVSDNEPKEITK